MNTLIQCSAESIFYFPFYDTQSRYFNKLQTALTTRRSRNLWTKILTFSLFMSVFHFYVVIIYTFLLRQMFLPIFL